MNHKKDFPLSSLPDSLYEAVRLFIINVSIRSLRDRRTEHNSMLIHASRFTAVHQKLAARAERYKDGIKRQINAYGKLPDAVEQSSHIKDLKGLLI